MTDPTPDEIKMQCAVIRETWDESEHRRRATGTKRTLPWTAPRVFIRTGSGEPAD